MNIGEVWSSLRVDGSKAKADAAKAGADAGDAAGKEMGARLKKGAAVIAGTLSGVLSVALIGRFAALEKATANFRKETGATAEEAARAGKAINEMAGRNLQSVEEIGETLTKVHTDLGLTGDEAERTAEAFLRFGQATGQDAAGAVLAFDDILDAWNLTATDSQAVMDALVLSHQKYGGSIEDNQRILAELAPSLRAANLTWQDGVGVLNLFAASGVDASTATTAMTKALTKVKSPEELDKLLTQIGSIEDPFKRAAAASDLFGAKAGAKLANALSNGGIDDYRVSLEETVGATDRAADASLTMVDRIKQGFSGFISGTVELLGPAGPLLTAIGSLGTLFAPAFKKVWQAVVGNAGVKGAIALAGSAAGVVYSAAAVGGQALMGAVSTAWAALGLPGSKAMLAAIASGRAIGLAAAASAAAAFIVIPLIVSGDSGPTDDINYRIEQIKRALADLSSQPLDAQLPNSLKTVGFLVGVLRGEMAALEKGDVDLANAIRDGTVAVDQFGNVVKEVELPVPNVDPWKLIMQGVGEEGGKAVVEGFAKPMPILAQTWEESWRGIRVAAHHEIEAGMQAIVDDLRIGMVDMHQTIKDGRKRIEDQMADLAWQMKHPFAEKNYADELRTAIDRAAQKMHRANERGLPGVAAQYKAFIDERKAELNSLPGVAAENTRKTVAALAPLFTTITDVSRALGNAVLGVFGHAPGFASGGTPPSSGAFWVGENGPELMTLNPPRVYDAETSQAMAAGADQTIHLVVEDRDGGLARAGISESGLARQIADALRGASESAGIGYLSPARL